MQRSPHLYFILFLATLVTVVAATTTRSLGNYNIDVEGFAQPRPLAVRISGDFGDRAVDLVGAFALSSFTKKNPVVKWDFKNAPNDLRYTPLLLHSSKFHYSNTDSDVTVMNPRIGGISMTPYSLMSWLNARNYKVDIKRVSTAIIDAATSIRVPNDLEPFVPIDIRSRTGIHLGNEKPSVRSGEAAVIYERVLTWLTLKMKTSKDLKFFICADNPALKQTFTFDMRKLARGLNKKIDVVDINALNISQSVMQQHNKAAMRALDFYCLASCKEIVQGMKHSPFSMGAALVSQNTLYNFADHDKEWPLLAWKPCLSLTLYPDVSHDHEIKTSELKFLAHRLGKGLVGT